MITKFVPTIGDCIAALRSLAVQRAAAKAAKAAWLASVTRWGRCDPPDADDDGSNSGAYRLPRCFEDERLAGRTDEWCDACRNNQPLYEAWQKASRDAAEALKLCVRIGKALNGGRP